jgi:hypothetical protein
MEDFAGVVTYQGHQFAFSREPSRYNVHLYRGEMGILLGEIERKGEVFVGELSSTLNLGSKRVGPFTSEKLTIEALIEEWKRGERSVQVKPGSPLR